MLLSEVCLTSVCLSVAYVGPNSRTERPRKIKIGTEVAHITRESDTTFKVKRSKVKVTRPLCEALEDVWRLSVCLSRAYCVATRTACFVSALRASVNITSGGIWRYRPSLRHNFRSLWMVQRAIHAVHYCYREHYWCWNDHSVSLKVVENGTVREIK